MAFFETMREIGILPVIKIDDALQAEKLACALIKGGLPAAEITFRTEAAEEAIYRIKKHVPKAHVCAGTVLTIENAERAVAAGAEAIISPGINPAVVRWCTEHRIPVVPGCATPSDVEDCMRMGLRVVKLFPAEVIGGLKMLKALSGPYPKMKFMPTGGIGPANVQNYLKLSNVLCCAGSWMVSEGALNRGDFVEIEESARHAFMLAKKVVENEGA